MIVSHPNSENFSNSDEVIAEVGLKVPMYIVTPSGTIKRFGPNRQDTKWVKSDVAVNVSYAELTLLRKVGLTAKFLNKWKSHISYTSELCPNKFDCKNAEWPRER